MRKLVEELVARLTECAAALDDTVRASRDSFHPVVKARARTVAKAQRAVAKASRHLAMLAVTAPLIALDSDGSSLKLDDRTDPNVTMEAFQDDDAGDRPAA